VANIDITHADLIHKYKFAKGAGGHWYNPTEDSDFHVHLMGLNRSPGYDPVKNPNPPEVLTVKKVELKVTQKNRWWGDIQPDGRFRFAPTGISQWGAVNKRKAADLLKLVLAQLTSD
jgi:hypothetical protein